MGTPQQKVKNKDGHFSYTKGDKKPFNKKLKDEDENAFLIQKMFGGVDDTVFCGVFDGHGPHGHVVAKKIRECFILTVMEKWNSRCHDDVDDYKTNTNNNKDGVLRMMRESFFMVSKFVDKELKLHYVMQSFGSGTIVVTLFKKPCLQVAEYCCCSHID
ncbi:probable protein phosphatase 2C 65 [Lathyrus oleraceus]|uniref:probable protein phosphatase 2C 65 n=1 Tax=Pisum sativum TaxID=3888 RepID=UPI0021D201AA|nr:probable protein phosphatase 2C 65 [Pisum sativum]